MYQSDCVVIGSDNVVLSYFFTQRPEGSREYYLVGSDALKNIIFKIKMTREQVAHLAASIRASIGLVDD